MTNKKLTQPERWVDEFGDYLFRYALSRVQRATVAEDLVQETFLAALKGHESFSGQSNTRTWMIGILKHKIIDFFRKEYRERPASEFQETSETSHDFFDRKGAWKEPIASWKASPDAILENKELYRVTQDCISQLPDRFAHAFTLREIEKLRSDEICDILNITPANLWVILHRSRLKLRDCLEKYLTSLD